MTVFDFNWVVHWSHSLRRNAWRGMAHELRSNRLRATFRLLAQARIQQVRPAISRASTSARVLLPRSVSLHGSQTRFDVAQAVAIGELSKSHAEKLIEARELAQSSMALVTLDAFVEFVLGQEVEELRKDRSASVHVPSFARR